MRTLTKKSLLVILGVIFGLLLSGLFMFILRSLDPASRPLTQRDRQALRERMDNEQTSLYLYDEDVSYRLKPNFVGFRDDGRTRSHRTNSLGILGAREISDDPTVTKVLLLGDSVTFGEGVAFELIFSSRMQQLAGSEFQLANTGCIGWSTDQQFRYYDKFLDRIDWQAIVIVFCLNDLVKFRWCRTRGEQEYDMVAIDSDSRQVGRQIAKLRNQFRGDKATWPLAKHDDGTLVAWIPVKWGSFINETLLPFVQRKDQPTLVFVCAPTRYQLEALSRGAAEDDVLFPQQQLIRFCEQNGVPYLDTIDAFREEAPELYYRNDSAEEDSLHFSALGHQVLAEYLWPLLHTQLDKTGATSESVAESS